MKLLDLAVPGQTFQIEQEYLNSKLKTVTAFYGDFDTLPGEVDDEVCRPHPLKQKFKKKRKK